VKKPRPNELQVSFDAAKLAVKALDLSSDIRSKYELAQTPEQWAALQAEAVEATNLLKKAADLMYDFWCQLGQARSKAVLAELMSEQDKKEALYALERSRDSQSTYRSK
jgi:hypothetical protein